MTPFDLAYVQVQRLYARQSLAIDGGDAAGWAATFSADGLFDSPTYPEPISGTAALEEFARGVHESSPHLHHLITNVVVDEVDDDAITVRANLLIVTTHDLTTGAARIDRITTIHDRFRRAPELLLQHRRVERDGHQDPTNEGATHD